MVTPQKPSRNNNNSNNHNSRNNTNNTDDRLPSAVGGVRGRVDTVDATEASVMACAEVVQAMLSSCTPPSTNKSDTASRGGGASGGYSYVLDGGRYTLLASLARVVARACLQMHASGRLHWQYGWVTYPPPHHTTPHPYHTPTTPGQLQKSIAVAKWEENGSYF